MQGQNKHLSTSIYLLINRLSLVEDSTMPQRFMIGELFMGKIDSSDLPKRSDYSKQRVTTEDKTSVCRGLGVMKFQLTQKKNQLEKLHLETLT